MGQTVVKPDFYAFLRFCKVPKRCINKGFFALLIFRCWEVCLHSQSKWVTVTLHPDYWIFRVISVSGQICGQNILSVFFWKGKQPKKSMFTRAFSQWLQGFSWLCFSRGARFCPRGRPRCLHAPKLRALPTAPHPGVFREKVDKKSERRVDSAEEPMNLQKNQGTWFLYAADGRKIDSIIAKKMSFVKREPGQIPVFSWFFRFNFAKQR